MKPLSGISVRRTRNYYVFWKAFFFVMVFVLLGGIYYATKQVDYNWRWYRVPRYFYYQDNVEITSADAGTISQIEKADGKTIVTVAGQGFTEDYDLPAKAKVRMDKGDLVFPGDVLGSYKVGKPGILIIGLLTTLKVSFLGIIAGIIIGLLAGLARLSENPALKWASITYIELIRGSPLLVQIFIWYFVFGTLVNQLLAPTGLPQIPPLWFGVASLATFAGAYIAEIVRAGIQSIHRGQVEAARSLGMTSAQCMRYVVLPQAIKRILPPLAGQFISLVKDSSLLGLIAIRELTKATREVITTSLMPFELWIVCAILYLVLTFALSMLLQWMERKMVS